MNIRGIACARLAFALVFALLGCSQMDTYFSELPKSEESDGDATSPMTPESAEHPSPIHADPELDEPPSSLDDPETSPPLAPPLLPPLAPPLSPTLPLAPPTESSNDPTPPGAIVCDPLSKGGTQGKRSGLEGSISVPPAGLSNKDLNSGFSTLNNYFKPPALDLGVTLYLSQINVSTRIFSSGFPLETGSILNGPDGKPVIEYFALNLKSQIVLPPDGTAGDYEFMLLSDDGAKLSFNGEPYLDFQGITATRALCSKTHKTVRLAAGAPLRLELQYFQGPRYHIALVLLARLIREGDTKKTEPECDGNGGNGRFFDPQGATKKAFSDLLKRGWFVVPPEAFQLQDDAPSNPCTL